MNDNTSSNNKDDEVKKSSRSERNGGGRNDEINEITTRNPESELLEIMIVNTMNVVQARCSDAWEEILHKKKTASKQKKRRVVLGTTGLKIERPIPSLSSSLLSLDYSPSAPNVVVEPSAAPSTGTNSPASRCIPPSKKKLQYTIEFNEEKLGFRIKNNSLLGTTFVHELTTYANNQIEIKDIIIGINGNDVTHVDTCTIGNMVMALGRPLTINFKKPDASSDGSFPVVSYEESDEQKLAVYQCQLHKQLELFEADKDDVRCSTRHSDDEIADNGTDKVKEANEIQMLIEGKEREKNDEKQQMDFVVGKRDNKESSDKKTNPENGSMNVESERNRGEEQKDDREEKNEEDSDKVEPKNKNQDKNESETNEKEKKTEREDGEAILMKPSKALQRGKRKRQQTTVSSSPSSQLPKRNLRSSITRAAC